MTVSKFQISAVIQAYIKNMRTRVGIGTRVRHIPDRVEVHVAKDNFNDIMHDRMEEEIGKKLREGREAKETSNLTSNAGIPSSWP